MWDGWFLLHYKACMTWRIEIELGGFKCDRPPEEQSSNSYTFLAFIELPAVTVVVVLFFFLVSTIDRQQQNSNLNTLHS